MSKEMEQDAEPASSSSAHGQQCGEVLVGSGDSPSLSAQSAAISQRERSPLATVSSTIPMASSSSSPPAAPKVQVIRPPAPGSNYQAPPATDDDPKPTAGELKRAFASVIAGRNGPDAPLMTKAMREREEAKYGVQRKVWKSVRIRIRFSDQTLLETNLGSTSGLQDLYDVIRGSFASEYTAKRFILIQALPRREFSPKDPALRGKSLTDLGFAPAAMLQIRFQDDAMNSSSHPAPLKPDLMEQALDIPLPKTFEDSTSTIASSEPKPREGQPEKTASGKPIPKWLKGLSKK